MAYDDPAWHPLLVKSFDVFISKVLLNFSTAGYIFIGIRTPNVEDMAQAHCIRANYVKEDKTEAILG